MHPIRRLMSQLSSGSFRKRWILTLLTASLLPLLITLVLVLNITSQHFQDQREETLLAEANRIQGSLEKRLESIRLVNENLSSYITSRPSRDDLYGKQNYMELLSYESMRDNVNAMEQIYRIDRIRIFTNRLPFVKQGNRINLFTMDDLQELSVQFPKLLEPVRSGSLQSLILENQTLPSKSIWGGSPVRTISLYSNVYNTDRELVAVFMSEFLAKDFLQEAQIKQDEAFVQLVAGDGTVVCRSGAAGAAVPNHLSNAPSVGYELRDGHLIFARTLGIVGWRLEVALPIGVVGIRGTLAEVYMVIILLSFLLSLVVSLVITRQTTLRLRQYLEAMKSADYTRQTDGQRLPDQLDQLIAASRANDEFDQLLASFSTLIRDNLRLLSRMKQRDLDIEKYKFQVLQEQINPHFLYNALETIRLCMSMNRREDAMHTLIALSKFYRIALSKGRDTIDISEELNMIRCYLEIENTGYEGRIRWDIQVDELCLPLSIPKFLLQPLIENSIVHGHISRDKRALTIQVNIHVEEDIVVMRVVDDGVGIDSDTLLQLQSQLSSCEIQRGTPGFGLSNVNHRLKLFYGSDYGLSIESAENGTINTIRLPIHLM